MVTRLKNRAVVVCGGGFTAGLIARQLTAKNIDVLVLERGYDRTRGAEAKLPNQRDELRWDVRTGLAQDWAVQTYSLRHSRNEEALPIRRLEAFLPGEGMGGGANHWNGQTWRWAEYDPILRTRLESRYGKSAIPAELTIQDWGVTYAELEPYHALWEKCSVSPAKPAISVARSNRVAIHSRHPVKTNIRSRRYPQPKRG